MSKLMSLKQMQACVEMLISMYGEDVPVVVQTWVPGTPNEILAVPEIVKETVHFGSQSREVIAVRPYSE